MARWIGAFYLALTAAVAAQPAAACMAYQPFDPNRVLKYLSREQIAKLPEVIIEGVVAPYDPSKDEGASKDYFGMTTMRVERVLKGDIEASVVLLFNAQSADCTHEPPFGQRIRFGASVLQTSEVLEFADPIQGGIFQRGMVLSPYRQALLNANRQVVYYRNFDLPLNDPALNALLEQHQSETTALQKAASTDGLQAQLTYGARLAENNETQRALHVYEAAFKAHSDDLDLLLALAIARTRAGRTDEPEATLTELERKSPKTHEWQNKIVRARFSATGHLSPDWKDWTELKPSQAPYCENRDLNFDGASFDRSNLAGCNFEGSSFRQASFIGSDLSEAYFGRDPGDVDLSDATYDCTTRFNAEFDPVKAGMVNVDGTCPKL